MLLSPPRLTLGFLAQCDPLAGPQLHPEGRRNGKRASHAAPAVLNFGAFTGARHSGTHSYKHSTQDGGAGSRICGQPGLHSEITASKNKSPALQ